MKNFKDSFVYIYKNILYLLLFAIVPSVLLGVFLSPFKFIEFINTYPSLPVSKFGDVFYAIVDISWLKLLFYVLAIIILSIFISLILGMIENHFRSGKRNIKNFKSFINNNIMNVFLNLSLLFMIYFIVSFLCATFIYLFHILISGIGATPKAFSIVIASLFVVIYFCLNICSSLICFLNIPNMLINGYNFKNSIGGVFNLLYKNPVELLVGMLFPYIFIIPTISLTVNSKLIILFNILGVLICLIYYSSFIMISYFSLNNINRYDNRRYYNIK